MSNFGGPHFSAQPGSLCLVSLRGVTYQQESWLMSRAEPSAQRKEGRRPPVVCTFLCWKKTGEIRVMERGGDGRPPGQA